MPTEKTKKKKKNLRHETRRLLHQLVAGLLGEIPRLLGMVFHRRRRRRLVLVVVLDNARGDRHFPGTVLLAGSLRVGRIAAHGHRRAGAVVHEVGGGRHARHAGDAPIGPQRVADVAALAGEAAVRVGGGRLATAAAAAATVLVVGILGQVQALDGLGALVVDAADDVGDGVGLVAQVAVGHVGDAHARQTLVAGAHVEQVLLQLGVVGVLHEGAAGETAVGAAGGLGGGGRVRLGGGGGGGDGLGGRLHGGGAAVRLLGGGLLDEVGQVGGGGGGGADAAGQVVHLERLAADQGAELQHDALGLVALVQQGGVGVLQVGQLGLVALAFALEFLGDLLLQHQGLEGVVALLLGAGQADGQAGEVVLLLVDEAGQAPVLALVGLDLDLELGGLLGELLGEGLELEELLLPGLELLDEEVVALGDLADLGVHAALEVDEVLPGLEGVAGVLVALADDLVEVAHGDLGHEGLLDGAAEEGLDAGVAAELLADVVHDGHDGVLVPPGRVLDALDLAAHDDDLAGGDELAAGVGGAQVVGDAGGGDVAGEGLGEAGDELGALAGAEHAGRAGGEDEVAVEVDDEGVGGRGEERAALGGDAEDVGAGFLDEVADVAGVDDGHVEATPLVDADAVADGLGGGGEDGGVVADEDDAAGGGDGGLEDADDVGDGEAGEEGPHGEVLEAGRGRGELVAEGVVLHVDAHEVVEARGGEAEDARDLLGVEEVGGLVPVDPHAAQVVAEQVVERVAGEEAEAVGDPVGLVGGLVVVGLGLLAQFADGVGAFLVGARPDAQGDAVEGVGGVLLEHEGVVGAVRLALAGADLDVVREAGAHGGMQGPGDLIVLLQPGAGAQDLGQPELPDGALHVADFALVGRGGPHPLGGFATHPTDHVGMGEGLGGALGGGLGTHLRGKRLDDAGMQRGGATGDGQRVVPLRAGRTVAGGGTGERGSKRRGHDQESEAGRGGGLDF